MWVEGNARRFIAALRSVLVWSNPLPKLWRRLWCETTAGFDARSCRKGLREAYVSVPVLPWGRRVLVSHWWPPQRVSTLPTSLPQLLWSDRNTSGECWQASWEMPKWSHYMQVSQYRMHQNSAETITPGAFGDGQRSALGSGPDKDRRNELSV